MSHENKTGTKITSTNPLTELTSHFTDNTAFSKDTTIGKFLNNDYLAKGTYLTGDQVNMIEDNTTWYLGTVGNQDSYRLAKYQSKYADDLTTSVTTTKIGLLRYGELLAGQFDKDDNNSDYWVLNPSIVSSNSIVINCVSSSKPALEEVSSIKSAMNLKSNVIITGGDGIKNNPFELSVQ